MADQITYTVDDVFQTSRYQAGRGVQSIYRVHFTAKQGGRTFEGTVEIPTATADPDAVRSAILANAATAFSLHTA